MALEHLLYIDTNATTHEIRELIFAGARFAKDDQLPDRPALINARTLLSIGGLTPSHQREFAEGYRTTMQPTRILYARCRGGYQNAPSWEEDVFVSIGLVLRAYPTADACVLILSDRPAVVRRAGKLVVSDVLTGEGRHLDPTRYPHLDHLDMAYSIGPIDRF